MIFVRTPGWIQFFRIHRNSNIGIVEQGVGKVKETDNQKMNCDHYRKRYKHEGRTLSHPAQENDCEAHDQHISGQNKEILCEGALGECQSENVSDVP